MADTFTNDLRLRLQESGANSGQWGSLLNDTITNIASAFSLGSEAIPNASTHTITLADDSSSGDEARSLFLKCTGGGQACTVTLAPNTVSKVWIISNETSFTLTFSAGSGANVAVAAGAVKVIVTDGAGSGAAVVDALSGLSANVSDLTTTGNISFGDNDKAIFGAGSDLQIYHDGTRSYISDSGTGDLRLQASEVRMVNAANTEVGFKFVEDGAASLYFNANEKLATTGSGIDVTGNITVGTNDTIIAENNIRFKSSGDAFIDHNTVGQDINFRLSNASSLDKTAMTLSSAGNVGIGTSSPNSYSSQTTLTINGSTYGRLDLESAGTLRASLFATTGSTTLSAATDVLSFDTSGGEAMRISGGNVGIGTSSPSFPLHVSGPSTNYVMSETAGTGTSAGFRLKGDANADFTLFTTQGTNQFAIYDNANSTQRMTIDSSGNVGIGTSSLTEKLEVNGSINAINQSANFATGAYRFFADIVDASKIARIGTAHGANTPSGTQGELSFLVNNSERARIDSSGNLLLSTTSIDDANGANITNHYDHPKTGIEMKSDSTSAHFAMTFRNPNGLIGNITTTGSATAFNTSSDQRLKENIADADDAGSKVDAIQVRKFDWIADGAHQDYGMVAQELQSVAPEAVSGDADSDEMMGVDYSKLVPMLIKEIQSLRARVAQLETEEAA